MSGRLLGVLVKCARCKHRRTRKTLCAWCSRGERMKASAKRRAEKKPGTPWNLGIEAFLDAIKTPDGFTRERYEEAWRDEPSRPALRLNDGGIEIRIVMDRAFNEWSAGDGHTDFSTSKGSRSFDRTGVDDSFHVENADTVRAVELKIAEQLKKVAESRERIGRSETIPGLPGGWSVTPERKAEIAAKLKAPGSHSFTPSGFGIGYAVSPFRRRYSHALPKETSDFFGIKAALYYETLDCD